METILAADSAVYSNTSPSWTEFVHLPSDHETSVHGRHSGRANVLWLDGHVNARKPATAYWSKGFTDVAMQERLHLGDIMRGRYTGDAQTDDYYYELVKPAGR